MRIVSSLLVLSACAGHYRTEHVGGGLAVIQPRATTSPAPKVGGIQLPRGSYELALRFDVPRAQLIEWNVACPGANVTGSVGEPFEDYRQRRLAQLRADRDQERRNVSALVGAIVPTVHVQTPQVDGRDPRPAVSTAEGRRGSVDATVSPANAIANAAVDDVVELPPGDVGQGRLQTAVHVSTTDDGACVVSAAVDDPNVIGGFDVTRVRDLDAEARQRAVVAATSARLIRAQLTTQLVAFGADATLPERRRAAEARVRAEHEAAEGRALAARAEAELRVRTETDARITARRVAEIAITVRRRSLALDARAELRARLVSWGADPELRARLAAQVEAERAARLHEIELRRDARQHQIELDEQRAAERLHQRVALALHTRDEVEAYLVMLGARERPPMPAAVAEVPGEPPFPGATWTSGSWRWTGAEWTWDRGGWSDPTRFGPTGGSEPVTPIAASPVAASPAVNDPTIVVVPVVLPNPRTPNPRTPRPEVRDHHSDPKPQPKVRDHR